MLLKELINLVSGDIEFYVDDHHIINNIYTPETIDSYMLKCEIEYITMSGDNKLVIGILDNSD